ncbi:MAG: hypothetical protein Q8S04_01705, partial [Bacteroidales bacterium]|nr:hypothetical protein [Bacteroidales bacterium]
MKPNHKARCISVGIFVLASIFFSITNIKAQENQSVYKSGDSPPEWFYQKRASYDFMKQIFFRVYGSEPSGWPHFIKETIKLDNRYKEFEAANGKPEHNLVNQFFLENDPVLKENPKVKYKEYRNIYESVLRNYYTIFCFRYPKTDPDGKVLPIKSNNSLWVRYAYKVTDYIPHDDKKMTASYHAAAEKEGMLPVVLYMFAFQCPPGMLEWYFREVFPAVDHLFTIESVEEKQKMFESVYLHINRLLEKMDRERAEVWSSTFSSFLDSYEYRSFQDLPVFFNSGRLKEIIYNSYSESKRYSTNTAIFNNHLGELLKGLSYTVPSKIYYHHTHEKPAQLTFVQNERGGVNFILYMDRSIPTNPFLERNNYRVTKSLDYSAAGIGMPSSEIKLDY